MVKTTSGHPSFTLAFRMDVMAPAKLIWLTMQVSNYDEESNNATLLLEQDEREEKRRALHREMEYKRRIVRYHNACVTEKKIAPGDLVMHNTHITGVN